MLLQFLLAVEEILDGDAGESGDTQGDPPARRTDPGDIAGERGRSHSGLFSEFILIETRPFDVIKERAGLFFCRFFHVLPFLHNITLLVIVMSSDIITLCVIIFAFSDIFYY